MNDKTGTMRWILLALIILILPGPRAEALAQPEKVTCLANAGVPPVLRVEGRTEYAGSLILLCTGGTPTPAGQPVPTVDLTLTFSTNSTSNLLHGDLFTEALLIVDEPNSANNPARPILNCGQAGAPDSGGEGPGICHTISTGDPSQAYDGTPNGFGPGEVCDGVEDRPAENTFGCGRPNVFQGRIPADHATNTVQFLGIPFDPPGSETTRILRFENVRLDASFTGVSWTFQVSQVQANVSLEGNPNVNVNNPQQIVAYVQAGGLASFNNAFFSFTQLAGRVPSASPIVVGEGFAHSFKPRNFSAFVGDNSGTPGNGILGEIFYQYTGSTHHPADIAQNVPGAIYRTESGFQWQNDSPNGPPPLNPPVGIGTVAVSDTGSPFGSAGFGEVNTGIDLTGVSAAGTRIAVHFRDIPEGVTVELPPTVPITRIGGSTTVHGVLALTATDEHGAGPFTPRTGYFNAEDNLAVYEVLFTDPFVLEQASIPFTSDAPPGTDFDIRVSFAPFYSTLESQYASAALPEPRFADTTEVFVCLHAGCLSLEPAEGTNDGPVELTVHGSRISATAGSILLRSDDPEIPPIPSTAPPLSLGRDLVKVWFDLTNAQPGKRDVVLNLRTGSQIVMNQAFKVRLDRPAAGVFRGGFFWVQDVDGDGVFTAPPDRAFAFGGVPGDVAISGDWNGSGTTKVGVYRPSNGLYVLDYDGDGEFTVSDKALDLGVGTEAGDVPVVGDWNGDGKTKVGLFRQGYFWILDTNGDGVFEDGTDQTVAFGGVAGDMPVVGDWNGNGISKLGLFRQGFFWILDANGTGTLDNVNEEDGDRAFAFGGIEGDVPLVGDWNGDGADKAGIFRAGFFWVLDANGNTQFDGTGPGQDLAFPFGGLPGDKPVVGKW